MRTNENQFALSSVVHYQSGEDVVVVLCHHSHHLSLEEKYREREKERARERARERERGRERASW